MFGDNNNNNNKLTKEISYLDNLIKEGTDCENNGVSILSLNILAEELLQFFWNKSYNLYEDTITNKFRLNRLIRKKFKNIKNIISSNKFNIVGLQEVSIPIDNIDDYKKNSYTRETYLDYLSKYETNTMKIADFSFKQNPMNYLELHTNYKLMKKNQNISNEDYKKHMKYFESGVLTLYNSSVLEVLETYNAEYFGGDDTEYLIISENNPPTYKKSKRGVGSPFILTKFKIKSTNEVFFSLNIHIKMNYPFIDSLTTIIERINELKKSKMKDFDWKKTIIYGDFNCEDYPKNNSKFFKKYSKYKKITKKKNKHRLTLKKYFKLKTIQSVFKKNVNYTFLKGVKIKVKKYKKIDIPVLKMHLNRIKDEKLKKEMIEYNNKLAESNHLVSDANPIYCYFYIGK